MEFIKGNQVGQHVTELAEKGAKEGWDPVASIIIKCSSCAIITPLTRGPSFLGGGLCFQTSDNLLDLEDSLSCHKCGSDSFEIKVDHKTFKERVCSAVDGRPLCEQNPAEGFLCDETNALIAEHSFQPAENFESLWSAVSYYMNEEWGMNENFSFDYITDSMKQTRYIKEVSGICHYNKNLDCLVILIKDTSGTYWYFIEHR